MQMVNACVASKQEQTRTRKTRCAPVTTTSPLVSLTLINPSLALALRKAVKDLYPECLMSTGVLVAETSLKDRYGKTYASEKTDGEIGKDDGGSFDNVVAID